MDLCSNHGDLHGKHADLLSKHDAVLELCGCSPGQLGHLFLAEDQEQHRESLLGETSDRRPTR